MNKELFGFILVFQDVEPTSPGRQRETEPKICNQEINSVNEFLACV